MLLKIKFDNDCDIIELPDFIVKDIRQYQSDFIDWMYDKTSDHSYWILDGDAKLGCCFRSEAFVDWLNENVLKNSDVKADVVDTFVPYNTPADITILF